MRRVNVNLVGNYKPLLKKRMNIDVVLAMASLSSFSIADVPRKPGGPEFSHSFIGESLQEVKFLVG